MIQDHIARAMSASTCTTVPTAVIDLSRRLPSRGCMLKHDLMTKLLIWIVAATAALGTLGCSVTTDDETINPEPSVGPEGSAVVQAQPYCFGSWRGVTSPYSHYTNLQLGGV